MSQRNSTKSSDHDPRDERGSGAHGRDDRIPSIESAADELTTIAPEAARRRAAVFLLTVGIVLLVVLGLRFVSSVNLTADEGTGSGDGSLPWIATLAVSGFIYILVSYPVLSGKAWAEWLGMVAALAQAIVFIALAVLSIVAGIRAGEPGEMTSGVLLFGTVAAVHLFLLRWLWISRRSAAHRGEETEREPRN